MSKRLAPLIVLGLVGEPALAQDPSTFATIAAGRTQAVKPCATAEYASAQQMTASGGDPFFDFNGTLIVQGQPIPGFSCQSAGPFRLNGRDWYLQNVRGMIPPRQGPLSKLRTNAVRICSEFAKKEMAKRFGVGNPHTDEPPPNFPPIEGPFGAEVGGFGCERLWRQDYTLP